MAQPTRERLLNGLAYVAITDSKKFLHLNTRVALMDYYDIRNVDDRSTNRIFIINEEGQKLLEQSPQWQAHLRLLAAGFEHDSRRPKPNYLHYRHRDDHQRSAYLCFGEARAMPANWRERADGRYNHDLIV